MRRETKIALAIGIPVVVGVGAYLAYKTYGRLKKYLLISVGEGGTTLPAPGTYMYNVGENVTITAFPDEGYTVGTWTVDGVEVARQVSSITVTMDADHTVIVTFWKGGQPPPGYPVAIYPEPGYELVSLTSNIGVRLYYINGTWGDWRIKYDYYSSDWSEKKPVEVPVMFRVVDAAGVGVPDVDVSLWVSEFPDKSRYHGKLLLDEKTSPVVKKTDSEGRVKAMLSYLYGLDDRYKTICGDLGIGYWISYTGIIIPYHCTCPSCAYDCQREPWWLGIPYGQHGGGETYPYLNYVGAEIVGAAKPPAYSQVKCKFNLQWVSFCKWENDVCP